MTASDPATMQASNTNIENAAIYTLHTAHQYQSRLLFLADLKASIAMGIVAIMITIATVLARLLLPDGTNAHMAPIFTLFVLFEAISFFLAMLVITPKIIKEQTLKRIEDTPNSLFFGFFTQFSQDEYVEYMNRELQKPDSAQQILLKDLYQIGLALRGKYTVLKYVYVFAAAGMVIPIIPTLYLALFVWR